MVRRSKSSGRWLKEHFEDPYVQRAQREGWRSRAALKLEELDRAERLIRPGMRIVDLGAAPGGWSQYAARRLGGSGAIIALDILPMDALAGVTFIQGDFREPAVLERLLEVLGDEPVDLVMSDMAPNLSGVDVVDQARSMELAELALDTALRILRGGGTFLAKVFQGAGFEDFVQGARRRFGAVRLRKPKASRQRSAETYLLARNARAV